MLAWGKGLNYIIYLKLRGQAQQDITGIYRHKDWSISRDGHNCYILCDMCGDLENWICEENTKETRCNSGLTGTLTDG